MSGSRAPLGMLFHAGKGSGMIRLRCNGLCRRCRSAYALLRPPPPSIPLPECIS